MDSVFLLVGPSGVGKTSAIREMDGMEVFILDHVIKKINDEPSSPKFIARIGQEQFFKKSLEAIEYTKSQNTGKVVIIDVGAGSLEWKNCAADFLRYPIIALTAAPEVLYMRVQNRPSEKRSFAEYKKSEFKPHKLALYEKARFRIDTTHLDSKQVAEEIRKIVSAER